MIMPFWDPAVKSPKNGITQKTLEISGIVYIT